MNYVQICNHCGRSVAPGSGLFVDRVPDCNDIETRVANNLLYPKGDYVCRECDQKDINWEDIYEDGKCPDCEIKIPKKTEAGDECLNCGHVFFEPKRDEK